MTLNRPQMALVLQLEERFLVKILPEGPPELSGQRDKKDSGSSHRYRNSVPRNSDSCRFESRPISM